MRGFLFFIPFFSFFPFFPSFFLFWGGGGACYCWIFSGFAKKGEILVGEEDAKRYMNK